MRIAPLDAFTFPCPRKKRCNYNHFDDDFVNTTCFVLAVTLGQLISSGVALACGRNWRLMLGLAAAPAIVQLILMFFLPESQRWLAKKYRDDECLETF